MSAPLPGTKPKPRTSFQSLCRGLVRWGISLVIHAGLLGALAFVLKPGAPGLGTGGPAGAGRSFASQFGEPAGRHEIPDNRLAPPAVVQVSIADEPLPARQENDPFADNTPDEAVAPPLIERTVFESPAERPGDFPTPEWQAAPTPPAERSLPQSTILPAESRPNAPSSSGARSPAPTDSSGGSGSPPGGPDGPGGDGGLLIANFFGLEGQGRRFVYVIDCSESMAQDGVWTALVAELSASLDRLPQTASVQVIVYNDKPRIADLGNRKPALVRNTPAQRRRIQQFVRGVFPAGGTDHLRALELALALEPDAIFFLTDGDEPRLTSADLAALRRLRRTPIPIQVVEFGPGTPPAAENCLPQLAQQFAGTYRRVPLPATR